MIEVLNLGAGVQSSTVLLMSIKGELPKLEHAIFADTGWEPAAVYRQMDWLEEQAVEAGIKVHRVSLSDIDGASYTSIKDDCLRFQTNFTGEASERQLQRGEIADGRTRWGSMPLFILGPDGEKGQIRRQCTYEYKIRPIERCLRRVVLGLKPRQRAPREPVMRQWFGISWDEVRRVRPDDEPWIKRYYPLCEKKITRAMCFDWFDKNGFHEPPRSACIGCPYHHNQEWREMKADRHDEWEEAVEFDKAIRKCGGMRGDVFLHSQRVPLDEANLWTDQDERQMSLFGLPGIVDECSGMCGV